MAGRSFAPAEKFVSEVAARKLRPGYVFIGDEAFFRDRCRRALISGTTKKSNGNRQPNGSGGAPPPHGQWNVLAATPF